MTKKTKLELTWPGKDKRPLLEPRILIEDPAKSFAAQPPARDLLGDADGAAAPAGTFDNLLIKGDNLLALKALEADYAGQLKCVFIDPPYNTGSAFEHYDDGIEHSLWLSLMRDRLELIHRLLAPEGFIFVQIDNNEMAYLKVLMDEIFGRRNFINDIVWKRRGGSANPNNRLNNVTDFILWYSKSEGAEIKPIYSRDDEVTQEYIEQRFTGVLGDRKYMLAPIERNAKLGMRETLRYEYNGYIPQFGWMMSRSNLEAMDKAERLHWNSKGRPNRRVFLEEYPGQPIGNLWTDIKVINPMAVERLNFDGQKPERLIERVLTLTTEPGDLVLDSFAGSGTTGAVAQKMGRRWIMIEIGDHADTHIVPRLTKVIDGSDQGGISKAVGWRGGGGFRYYTLAPSLLERDPYGNLIISREYDAPMLARALCQHLGFDYAPSADEQEWWRHGQSSETDFLYVTTQSLTHDALKLLSEAVGSERTLMICARAFAGSTDSFANLTCRKIPATILTKCEWGRDDYSLNVDAGAVADVTEDEDA